ncbi:MAG: hypothetical protein JXA10_11165 [Anaerolineae bacterium]|nr:hypothetical protein [Anaerolineae bacterium]
MQEVFILAGQSNMVGYGKIAELPRSMRKLPPNITLKNHCPRGFFARRRKFGPEIAFANVIASAMPGTQVLLVKYAVNATSLLAWSPEWSAEQAARTANADVGPLYATLTQHVKNALRGQSFRFAGILWMQGERDALYPDAAQEYKRNFTALIARFRADTHTPDLPVIFGQIMPPDEWTGRATVQQALASVAQTVPYTALVPTDDIPKDNGPFHYGTAGQLLLGRRFAEAYLKMKGYTT